MAAEKIKRLYLIPILSKALDVLEMLEAENAALALEEIYQRTHISKTSVYRILKTLVHRGYVAHTESGGYRLVSRPKRLKFGLAVQSGEMAFSQQVAASVAAAAADSGVELMVLDNRSDAGAALGNVEEFVRGRVDLVLEFQADAGVAPHVAHKLKLANIPVIAIDVPHPNATYFGVDNFEVGVEAGALLAQHAQKHWQGQADWVLGVGLAEAGSFVQSRISGAFEEIGKRLNGVAAERFVRLEGRGLRGASEAAVSEFVAGRPGGERFLVAAATDASALGVMDAARASGRAAEFAIVGQDCIPEALEAMAEPDCPLIGSVSHEAQSYGPRLMQLGITLLRGNAVPPYNYVRHRVVTAAELREGGR